MANESYLVTTPMTITREEGNSGKIDITVQNTILIGTKDVLFQIRDLDGGKVLEKTKLSGITVIGQNILILLQWDDLIGHAGDDLTWELLIENGTDYTTIGKGDFVINKRRIWE